MTNVLSTFAKCVFVKLLCCCARVLQCQPRWRPIANHLYDSFVWLSSLGDFDGNIFDNLICRITQGPAFDMDTVESENSVQDETIKVHL